jgi:hypothetical protein
VHLTAIALGICHPCEKDSHAWVSKRGCEFFRKGQLDRSQNDWRASVQNLRVYLDEVFPREKLEGGRFGRQKIMIERDAILSHH